MRRGKSQGRCKYGNADCSFSFICLRPALSACCGQKQSRFSFSNAVQYFQISFLRFFVGVRIHYQFSIILLLDSLYFLPQDFSFTSAKRESISNLFSDLMRMYICFQYLTTYSVIFYCTSSVMQYTNRYHFFTDFNFYQFYFTFKIAERDFCDFIKLMFIFSFIRCHVMTRAVLLR